MGLVCGLTGMCLVLSVSTVEKLLEATFTLQYQREWYQISVCRKCCLVLILVTCAFSYTVFSHKESGC